MKITSEAWKTIVLCISVLLSVVLTWNIWFFQIDINNKNTPQNSVANIVSIAQSKDTDEVIKPYLAILQKNGLLLGQTNSETVSKIYSLFEQGKFSNIIPVSTEKELPNHNGESAYEIVFPAPLTIDALTKIFAINTENYDINKNLLIDRIELYYGNSENKNVAVFRQKNDEPAFYTNVTGVALDSLSKVMNPANLTSYAIQQLKNKKVFIPREKISVDTQLTVFESLSFQKFKPVFFQDNAVHSSENYYSDGKQQLEKNGYTIQYANPNIPDTTQVIQDSILNSFDYVNRHKGWTNDYIYDDYNPLPKSEKNEVNFRMMIGGYPLYSTAASQYQYLPSINLVWKSGEVYTLNRNILKFNTVTTGDTRQLPSGSQALETIHANADLKSSDIQDLRIGYELDKDKLDSHANQYSELIPDWFYKQDNRWHSLSETKEPKNSVEEGASSS